ncbi:MAG: hypothetical protein LBQ50_07150 [Planctomycetaceae bacterium]|nr:hypothetical protein [Planctomycetaceae bacterium]
MIGQIVIVTIGNKNSHVSELIDWFLSPQGQNLIERVGYVPLRKESATSQDTVSVCQ